MAILCESTHFECGPNFSEINFYEFEIVDYICTK